MICDVSFTHTSGCRPYSYGLQACNATSAILIAQFNKDFKTGDSKKEMSIEDSTQIYESNNDL